MCQIIILNVNKCLNPLYIGLYCQYCKYSQACLSIVQNVIICLLSINVQCNLKDLKKTVFVWIQILTLLVRVFLPI